jgi:methylglutaconyl-CoA hydratase
MSRVTTEKTLKGVVRVVMNRPEVFNAFDETMIDELDATFKKLSEDTSVRVIVLCGEGRHFSAGADLDWMRRAASSDEEWNLGDARRFAQMLLRINLCPKPVVARVQGVALGGGVGLISVCDVAIATEGASFAVSEAKFGILPAVIGPFVINAIGKRQAKRLALTTSRINAKEALQVGLVHQVVSEERMDDALEKLCEELLLGGPNAQAEIKKLFSMLSESPVTDEVSELTARTIARVRTGKEAREGFDAFFSKRPPPWVSQ